VKNKTQILGFAFCGACAVPLVITTAASFSWQASGLGGLDLLAAWEAWQVGLGLANYRLQLSATASRNNLLLDAAVLWRKACRA